MEHGGGMWTKADMYVNGVGRANNRKTFAVAENMILFNQLQPFMLFRFVTLTYLYKDVSLTWELPLQCCNSSSSNSRDDWSYTPRAGPTLFSIPETDYIQNNFLTSRLLIMIWSVNSTDLDQICSALLALKAYRLVNGDCFKTTFHTNIHPSSKEKKWKRVDHGSIMQIDRRAL